MNIFNHDNYRNFLNSWLKEQNSNPKGTRFNASRLAELLRVHPTFVSQVLKGNKDLSLEHAIELGKYLDFSSAEKEYLLLLIQKEKAGSKDLKIFFEFQIKKIRDEHLNLKKTLKDFKTLDDEQKAIFYSSWLYTGVWVFCGIRQGATPEEIAAHFQISRSESLKILEFLISVGAAVLQNGHYQMGPQHLHLSNDSPFIGRHHTNWRLKSLQRMDRLSQEELLFTAPMSIAKKDFLAIRDKITALIKDVVTIAKDSPAEDLACLNIDLFWPLR